MCFYQILIYILIFDITYPRGGRDDDEVRIRIKWISRFRGSGRGYGTLLAHHGSNGRGFGILPREKGLAGKTRRTRARARGTQGRLDDKRTHFRGKWVLYFFSKNIIIYYF